jgi:hypothetical protein
MWIRIPSDDLVCPWCKVLLRDGTRMCVKCGRMVDEEIAQLEATDLGSRILYWLNDHFGSVFGDLIAAVLFLALTLVGIALLFLVLWFLAWLFSSTSHPVM